MVVFYTYPGGEEVNEKKPSMEKRVARLESQAGRDRIRVRFLDWITLVIALAALALAALALVTV